MVIIKTTVEKMCHYSNEVSIETVGAEAERIKNQIIEACKCEYPCIEVLIRATSPDDLTVCPECLGEGFPGFCDDEPCPTCAGAGRITLKQKEEYYRDLWNTESPASRRYAERHTVGKEVGN